jgi:hypothetical protein
MDYKFTLVTMKIWHWNIIDHIDPGNKPNARLRWKAAGSECLLNTESGRSDVDE